MEQLWLILKFDHLVYVDQQRGLAGSVILCFGATTAVQNGASSTTRLVLDPGYREMGNSREWLGYFDEFKS